MVLQTLGGTCRVQEACARLGISEPQTSWGLLISDGAAALNPLRIYWWLVVFPGVHLAITLFCLNSVGDGMRDAFDVQQR